MIKLMFAVAVLAAATVPAFADDMMMCDDAHMMKAEESAKKATGDKMAMAMKDVDAAKMAMKDGKMDDCKMHLDKVMKDTM
jgi:predicted outer membrane protein